VKKVDEVSKEGGQRKGRKRGMTLERRRDLEDRGGRSLEEREEGGARWMESEGFEEARGKRK